MEAHCGERAATVQQERSDGAVMAAAMAESLFSWSGEDAATAVTAWWWLGAGSGGGWRLRWQNLFSPFFFPWVFGFVSLQVHDEMDLEARRDKEREHLDGNNGVVEACRVNIAPISAGLQPQLLEEAIGGQLDLLCRILAEGLARVGEPSRHSNCVQLLFSSSISLTFSVLSAITLSSCGSGCVLHLRLWLLIAHWERSWGGWW
ncbi:hypothetical protein V8G54_003338 [Vigna mungo]|uniref:Uncharacterized protein n=1 Tax=Vigna mungo TaxID=3915 RepID=A0AAQ3PC72_VIGMU